MKRKELELFSKVLNVIRSPAKKNEQCHIVQKQREEVMSNSETSVSIGTAEADAEEFADWSPLDEDHFHFSIAL